VPYLSEIQQKRVLGPSGDEVARLKDVAVVPREQFPAVQWAILATRGGERAVRWTDLSSEIGHYRIRVPLDEVAAVQLPDEALRLGKDLLDKQIVDTHGAKVVRVNDLRLEETGGSLRLVGADVGFRGLLRRVGGEGLADSVAGIFGRRLARGIIPWHLVEPIDAAAPNVRLTVPHAKLALLHPADIADIVEDMSVEERRAVFEQLDVETAADALGEVEPDMQVAIVGDLDEERAADILDEMAPDEAVDLLQDLPEEQRDDLMERMEKDESEDVEELLTHPEDSAGGMMTSGHVALARELTAGGAIEQLRELKPDPELAYYVYVVDAAGKLGGVVSLRDLVVADPATPLERIMNEHVMKVATSTSKEEVASLIAKYDLLALPVVDDDDVLVGTVTVDDVVELMLPRGWKKRSLRTIAR
jgi:CBS domain-containing protein